MILANPDYRMWWREQTFFPTGDGFYTGVWVKNSDCSPGGCWERVDETTSDGDTTFIETDGTTGGGNCAAATGPGKESFALSPGFALNPNDDYLRVTVNASRRRIGGTPSTFRVGIREGGADSFGTTNNVPTGYANETAQFNTKPSGGNWNYLSLLNAQPIIESISLCPTCDVRVTQVYETVEFVVMPAMPLPLQAAKRRKQKAELVYMPPEFFVYKPRRRPPQTAAAPSPYFSDKRKKGRLQWNALIPTADYNFTRRQIKALPFGGAPPPSTAVFTQPRRVFLNRRGPSITVKRGH